MSVVLFSFVCVARSRAGLFVELCLLVVSYCFFVAVVRLCVNVMLLC